MGPGAGFEADTGMWQQPGVEGSGDKFEIQINLVQILVPWLPGQGLGQDVSPVSVFPSR